MNNAVVEMKELLKKVAVPYGATGREETVADVIRREVEPYCDDIRTDAMGNLICIQHGEGARIMFAAHMDHIGFIVTDIDEKGFLRVTNVGGIDTSVSLDRHVAFENGVQGVVAVDHDAPNASRPAIDKLYIDIGAASREEAEALVERGDIAVYAPDWIELANDRIASPAMDNRAACCVLASLLKKTRGCGKEIAAVFTVQEEVGLRGAQTAAYSLQPDVGIALDVTLCGDAPECKGFCMKLGGGAAVKIMDSSVICHTGVTRALEEAGRRCGCTMQREVLTGGGTDAAAIQQSRSGVRTGALSIPCRHVHSACEMVDLKDMAACVDLLREYLKGEKLY